MHRNALAAQRRAVAGGRSERYDSRRAHRCATRQYAPRWTDAAADATWRELSRRSAADGDRSQDSTMLRLLQKRADLESVLHGVARAGTTRDETVARKASPPREHSFDQCVTHLSLGWSLPCWTPFESVYNGFWFGSHAMPLAPDGITGAAAAAPRKSAADTTKSSERVME